MNYFAELKATRDEPTGWINLLTKAFAKLIVRDWQLPSPKRVASEARRIQ